MLALWARAAKDHDTWEFMIHGNLRTCDKMADRKKKPWGTFRNKMLAKRCKTGDGGGRKIGKGNILQRQELVEQRLSSEVSRKAKKYTGVRPCEFVQYNDEELSIEGIKVACEFIR